MSGWNWIERFGHDLRFGLRGLRKSASFTLVAIVVLALGTGANTAIFGIVHAVLLRPLPFHDPDQVMLLFEKIPKRGVNRSDLCAANFFDLQQRNQSFTVTAIVSGRGFALTGDASPEQVAGALVSSSFFSVLGVSPEVGSSRVSRCNTRRPISMPSAAAWSASTRMRTAGAGWGPHWCVTNWSAIPSLCW